MQCRHYTSLADHHIPVCGYIVAPAVQWELGGLEATLSSRKACELYFKCHESSADTVAGLQATIHEVGRLPHTGLWAVMRVEDEVGM
jgi:hypothetical protein